MRIKKYTHGVSVFMTFQMYEDFRRLSDERQVGLSELFRTIVSEYLQNCSTKDPHSKGKSPEA